MNEKTQTPAAVITFITEAEAQAMSNVHTLAGTAREESRVRAYQNLKAVAAQTLRYEAEVNLETLMNACAKILRNPADWGTAGCDLAHNVLLTIARSL